MMIATTMWLIDRTTLVAVLPSLTAGRTKDIALSLLGAGTAMVYPTLLAAIGDVTHPTWRASAVGVYRLWRDGGFAIGALLAGLIADAYGIRPAIWTIAVLTAATGLLAAVRMYETHPRT
ncbi:MFS transporter [Actinomadura sp. KC216]|uniref:MFS transporter n=1 Tax=Actinomadura sp. KC216 TaxID=2530370 RepID=UPI001A9D6717|nr:MFS transporter [Actinomadura sp. KC216]